MMSSVSNSMHKFCDFSSSLPAFFSMKLYKNIKIDTKNQAIR